MHSSFVKKAVSSRHSKDYFATEVKTGSSFQDYVQFDCYAVAKSWTNLKYTGYEVKTSRSDFLQDKKWRAYLPFCNELYWACPEGLIKKDEVDEVTGLIYVYESGVTRIVKRANYRPIDPPVTVLLYLLMWRCDQTPYPFFGNDKLAYFKSWLEDRTSTQEIGQLVANKTRRMFDEFQSVKRELRNLESYKKKYKDLCNELQQFPEIVDWSGTIINDKKLIEIIKSGSSDILYKKKVDDLYKAISALKQQVDKVTVDE